MKITSNTLTILKSFAKINKSIVVQPGNVLATMHNDKTIVAKASITEQFEQKFAIYDLDKFISVLSLFTEPELTFQQKYVTISDGKRSINYTYAEESFITQPPAKEIKLPSEDIKFTLKADDLKAVERALSILELTEFSVQGDGEKILLRAVSSKNPTSDTFSVQIGESDRVFNAIFRPENIRILPGDYNVVLSAAGFSYFTQNNLQYWIAVEESSTY